MSCKKCLTEPYFSSFCEKCFADVIDKRIRKVSRENSYFSKGDAILVYDKLSEYFLNSIAQDLPIKVIFCSSDKKPESADKMAVKYTMDDEANEFLNEFLSSKVNFANKAKFIRLLGCISDKEALAFAKLKNIEFKPNNKGNIGSEFLNKISQNHDDAIYGLSKCIKELKSILE